MRMGRIIRLAAVVVFFFVASTLIAEGGEDERLRVEVGPVIMTRGGNDNIRLVTDSFATGGVQLLNANELDLGYEVGPDGTIAYRFTDAIEVEARYFNIWNWSETRGNVFSAPGAVVRFVTPLGNTAFPNNISAKYRSELQSGEINFRWLASDRFALFAGPRYIEIDEKLTIMQDIGPGANMVDNGIDADNRMMGGQIGIEGLLFELGENFAIDGVLKAGYYNNNASANTIITQSAFPTLPFSCNDSTDKGSFVGEVGANLTYAATDTITLALGYQYMWLQNVAVAPRQIYTADPNINMATVDLDSVYYHGGKAECRIVW